MAALNFLALLFITVLALATNVACGKRCLSQAPLACDLQPTAGNQVRGRIIFTTVIKKRRCLVRVRARITGLGRRQQHGWHIHTYGDLSLADGTAQGGHFTSPLLDERPHGFPQDKMRHWGDLGNLLADSSGVAMPDQIDSVISLRGIVGRGIIVHADRDQGSSVQPTGGSGARLAQCVIGFANPERVRVD